MVNIYAREEGICPFPLTSMRISLFLRGTLSMYLQHGLVRHFNLSGYCSKILKRFLLRCQRTSPTSIARWQSMHLGLHLVVAPSKRIDAIFLGKDVKQWKKKSLDFSKQIHPGSSLSNMACSHSGEGKWLVANAH
ncbi:unnamed protein product [Linum trigynum]|uniref:Uncharacterized protein n=1 Tax=Linum trigynum TaxID=586398 RepID=A0AAV2E129_9ROSI